MFGKRTTTNTGTSRVALICQWSMAGAPGDLDSRFAAPPDLHAVVVERTEEPAGEAPPYEQPPLMMKPADEDDWRPLLVGVPDPA